MSPTGIPSISRRLLQDANVDTFDGISATTPFSPTANHTNGSSSAPLRRPFSPPTPFDSSMALTILVLLTALFFIGFFSVYIRRFAVTEDPSPPTTSRRRPTPPIYKRGADPSTVRSLPLVAYGKAAKHPMIDDCPICLSEFQEEETVKLIPYCSHVFHPMCIDTWLSLHVTCPLCRSAQLLKRIEEVRLDVTQDKIGNGVMEVGEGSTANGMTRGGMRDRQE